MAVYLTNAWRVRPGKMQEFMADLTTAKKIIQRLGGKVHVRAVLVGSNAPATVFTTETSDWKAYGEFSAKIDADSEWQTFWTKVVNRTEPTADSVGNGLSSDVPIG